MAQPPSRSRAGRPLPPLDRARLEQLALGYAGRYLTTRARLRDYLRRKLRERGGAEDCRAAIDPTVERMAALRYVDDGAFAAARAGSLARRGLGRPRVEGALRGAGISPDDAAAALGEDSEERSWAALLRFAARKRIGPYAVAPAGPDDRRRAFAAILRAGHAPRLAARLLALGEDEAGDLIDAE